MSEKIIFKGCKFLDFSDNYMAKKVLIQVSVTKVCWDRKDPEGNLQLCQFCQKRGRLNSPEACLSEKRKHCSDYEEFEHSVTNVV